MAHQIPGRNGAPRMTAPEAGPPSPGVGAGPQRRFDLDSLVADAREAVFRGRIPGRPADAVWGGPGTGGPCAICGMPLEATDVEYELEFKGDTDGASYHAHVACCMAWELELS